MYISTSLHQYLAIILEEFYIKLYCNVCVGFLVGYFV